MLTEEQLGRFACDGFLVIEDVLSPARRDALVNEYQVLINAIAAADLSRPIEWSSWTFEEQFTYLVANFPEVYEKLDISLPLVENFNEESSMHVGPAVFGLLTDSAILDIVESIVGPEIVSNPVQHVRIKPPETALSTIGKGNSNMARTGWHQDAAVIVEEAEQSPILTVWVAVTDATPEMGCMQAIPGSHHWPQIGMHCPGKSGVGEIFIPQEYVGKHELVDLEVKAGGLVLLHKNTWHGAGPNKSSRIRWSFDLRYQPPGFSTGRECFPSFLARSKVNPDDVLIDFGEWANMWLIAKEEIVSGRKKAIFNERWLKFRDDPLCA